ncbi:MAG: leucine-rich repeat domain-containing protein [Bacteroidaceae bacterium]|nr:leucine-rich repeat domain-containing protein [Bacteroidaceae bacterium]
MKKKLLLTLVALTFSIGTWANGYVIDGINYILNDNNRTASVTYTHSSYPSKSNNYKGNVIIPSSITYNGSSYSVTSIGDEAFHNCSGLTSITIPNSVTSIGDLAFLRCSGLTSITIPNSVTSIGSDAFSGCSGLTSITIPESVTSIGGGAFKGCSGLTSITIPESVTSIGNSAFYRCTGLTSITIPNSVTSIGYSAFCRCSGLTSITIPNSVTSIDNYAFDGCSGLTSITIPNSVTSIDNYAFDGCSGLTSVTINSNAIASIKYTSSSTLARIFGTQVKEYVLGEEVKSIGDYAFYGCSGLTSVTIPERVTSIGYQAFSGCSGLTKAEFASVESLCGIAFSYGSNPLSYAHHLYIDGKEVTDLVIPESVTSIGNYAFYDCSGLTSITIPNSVTSIGNSAFYGCSGLTKAEFASVESLCGIVFKDWVSNPLSYAHHLYIDGKEVTDLVIPKSVTSIGNSAFSGCSGLTSITIPESVTSIGDYAFYNCSGLTSITIPEGVTSIGEWGFSGCSGMTSITIPESITAIGNSAFSGCSGLNSITISNNMTSIGKSTFEGCTAKIYVNRGTKSCLCLWIEGYTPYEIRTGNKLIEPTLSVESTTQTTATININNYYKEYNYTFGNNSINNESFLITGRYPEYHGTATVKISLEDVSMYKSVEYSTKNISPQITIDKTASSISAQGTFVKGDAKVIGQYISISGVEIKGNAVNMTGLMPDNSFEVKYYITVAYGNDESRTYSTTNVQVTTQPLTLETQQPKVISEGNVIVAATSNLDDEEKNVGFEWRRQDWTDDFDSKTGGAYMYEGQMEGYIRSINANYLWKFRPYYEANNGLRYYGEWKGIDPADFSYFEPTVHTYSKVNVNGNTAQVSGYAQRGTDNITSQGFMYWRSSTKSSQSGQRKTPAIPSDAKTIEAIGTVMEANLTDLEYESTYNYVAFIRTSEGETFYGETKTFQTGEDLTSVEEIPANDSTPRIVARYNIQGHRIGTMQRGINIIRMSDGTVRKVMVK